MGHVRSGAFHHACTPMELQTTGFGAAWQRERGFLAGTRVPQPAVARPFPCVVPCARESIEFASVSGESDLGSPAWQELLLTIHMPRHAGEVSMSRGHSGRLMSVR